MVDRQEVEALVREIEEGCREHSCTPHDMSLDVEGDTLAALCRAWLALEDAPEVCVSKSALMGEGWKIYGTDGNNIESLPFNGSQRVRIVKEALET